MNFKRPRRIVLFTLLALAACTARNKAAGGENEIIENKIKENEITKAQPRLETASISIQSASGAAVVIKAELARTPRERQAGLMFRKSLKDGEGMLFIFENDEAYSFWMKNTVIPLSAAFIYGDGTILEIKNLYPNDLASVHPSRSIRYVLEAPQGWFERAGVGAGDRLDLSGL
ncbi:MAG: DUF192 domain-containing protein [Treponema sp.]|jgi:uncharacterized membrane protein (UPF0127 family)|nr:DUF192 domain-containing protein [Treponema sp.]